MKKTQQNIGVALFVIPLALAGVWVAAEENMFIGLMLGLIAALNYNAIKSES